MILLPDHNGNGEIMNYTKVLLPITVPVLNVCSSRDACCPQLGKDADGRVFCCVGFKMKDIINDGVFIERPGACMELENAVKTVTSLKDCLV